MTSPRYIDFHGHFLPGMDDGSRNEEQSLSMLHTMKEQGIKTAFATPHFYADDERIPSFLERREAAYERLKPYLTDEHPEIRLGAEVRHYDGISRLDGLQKLCAEDTELLLLEMPFTRWTDYSIDEVLELASGGGVTVVLAHIERYYGMQKKDVWEKFLLGGILLQINARMFESFFEKRKALSWFEKQMIHFIGSDCHNDTTRPPNAGKAFEVLKEKMGERFVGSLLHFEEKTLANKRIKI